VLRGLAKTGDERRLRDWRRSVVQLAVAVMVVGLLAVMHRPGAEFQTDLKLFGGYALPGIIVIAMLVRRMIRRLPAFLKQEG
jgi:hypothetical protein